MKFSFDRLTAFASVLLCAGCVINQSAPRPTIPLVESIISNPQSREYKLLSAYDGSSTKGDIVILDEPERCFCLSERFLKCDDRDNMDAAPVNDFLPDFSGERIISILDFKYSPYGRYIKASNDGALREIAVKSVISAVDTICLLGPYDHDFKSVKPTAKLIVVSSPHLAAFGSFDVDTLLHETGAHVPVINAPEAMISRVLDRHGAGACFAFIAPESAIKCGAYEKAFSELALERSDRISRLVSLLPSELKRRSDSTDVAPSEDVLRRWLDAFAESGVKMPLSALVVDDFSVSIDSLKASLEALRVVSSDENDFYRKLLSRDFEIVDGARVITDTCYTFLRKRNLFTHNIAYPVAGAYITSPEEKSYALMDFNISDLPDEMIGEMERLAPKTSRLYVQDQYYGRGN